ncbi:MAG: hypothetical protein QXG39_00015 [Candidatus Aenigmatarchaeota archaeon]
MKRRIKVWHRRKIRSKAREEVKPIVYTYILEKKKVMVDEIKKLLSTRYEKLVEGILGELKKEGEIEIIGDLVLLRKNKVGKLEI